MTYEETRKVNEEGKGTFFSIIVFATIYVFYGEAFSKVLEGNIIGATVFGFSNAVKHGLNSFFYICRTINSYSYRERYARLNFPILVCSAQE